MKEEYINVYKRHQIEKKTWIVLLKLLLTFKAGLGTLYPNLLNIIKIAATMPVTVASQEHTHSKV